MDATLLCVFGCIGQMVFLDDVILLRVCNLHVCVCVVPGGVQCLVSRGHAH